MRGPRSKAMGENVWLFIPNLIGYARILLAIISFYFMPFDPAKAGPLYLLSSFLDEIDGIAARAFNQESKFGAVLDMVTDRCATTCLIIVLGFFYPQALFVFQLVVALDISSHWLQMYSSLLHGENSHKITDLSANPVMRLYYWRPALSLFCAGNEMFFASLYFTHFSTGPMVSLFGYQVGFWVLTAILTAPISIFKNLISVLQLVIAVRSIVSLDTEERTSLREKQS